MTEMFAIFGNWEETQEPLRLTDHHMVTKGGVTRIMVTMETKDHFAAARAMQQLDGVKTGQKPPRHPNGGPK